MNRVFAAADAGIAGHDYAFDKQEASRLIRAKDRAIANLEVARKAANLDSVTKKKK